jgi:ABC-type transport system substrate-binding protein
MAICYALDCAGISSGISYPAYEVFGPQPNMYDAPESWTTGDGVEYYNYNVELAKEYLSRSGYDGKTLTLMYIDQGAITDFVIMLQSNLRQVGINIEMMPLEATTMDAYRSDYEAWDIIADIQGGGNYCANTLKKFWTGDYTDSKGNSVLGIVDSKLDDLYLKVKNEGGTENIEAWNDYFTYEKCYGLAVCRYFEQTACLSSVNAVVVGANNMLVAGAFTFND